MTLLSNIKQDRITAMKNGDKATRETLQLLLAKVEKAQIENKAELTNEQVQAVISKNIKELDKEMESYVAVGRPTDSQEKEKELLLSYLPKQLTEDEVKAVIAEFAKNTADTGMKIGEAMKELSAILKGKADMKLVSKLAKDALQ